MDKICHLMLVYRFWAAYKNAVVLYSVVRWLEMVWAKNNSSPKFQLIVDGFVSFATAQPTTIPHHHTYFFGLIIDSSKLNTDTLRWDLETPTRRYCLTIPNFMRFKYSCTPHLAVEVLLYGVVRAQALKGMSTSDRTTTCVLRSCCFVRG